MKQQKDFPLDYDYGDRIEKSFEKMKNDIAAAAISECFKEMTVQAHCDGIYCIGDEDSFIHKFPWERVLETELEWWLFDGDPKKVKALADCFENLAKKLRRKL